jgi:CubicO group peptidase (beta-lactamase class C family)
MPWWRNRLLRVKFSGVVALIVRDVKAVYHWAKGKADVESGRNMSKDAIFRFASQTKAITYAKFLQMYLNGGEYNGIRILSRKTIEAMMAYQSVDLYPNEGVYQGLGFVVCTDKTAGRGGIGSPGTFNWGGAFNTDYFADPKENIIGIIMKQTDGSSESTTWIFRQMVYSLLDD